MRIDTYQNTANGTQYLSVPSGTDLAKISLPDGFDIPAWKPFHRDQEIIAGESRVAMDTADVIKQIGAGGYALHRAGFRVEITEIPKKKQ